jgi:hypothetical protein
LLLLLPLPSVPFSGVWKGLEQFSKRMVPLVETRRVLSLLY